MSRARYDDESVHNLFQSAIHRCASCDKLEPDAETKFPTCSRCKLVFYCSKQCQLDHWKTHKRLCHSKTTNQQNKLHRNPSAAAVQLTAREKVYDFRNHFRPILMNMTLWTMHRYFGTDCGRSHWRGDTHVLLVQLGETTQPAPVALQIEATDVSPITAREPVVQTSIRKQRQAMANEMGRDDSAGFLLLFYRDDDDGDGSPLIRSEMMSFLFEGTFCQDSFNRKTARFPRSKQAMLFDMQVIELKEQINAMATGNANSSMEAAEKARASC